MEVSPQQLLDWTTPEPNTGCWLWTRLYRPNGYPRLRYRLKDHPVSRIMWSVYHRSEIPAGMVVRHTCDVPGCINPDHLIIGTPKDNTADAVKRGRLWAGFADLARKLTESDKAEILGLARAGFPDTTICKEFGVSPPVVQRLRRAAGVVQPRWDRSRAAVDARSAELAQWRACRGQVIPVGSVPGPSRRSQTLWGIK